MAKSQDRHSSPSPRLHERRRSSSIAYVFDGEYFPSETPTSHGKPTAPDLETYTHQMRHWTLTQLRRSSTIPPYTSVITPEYASTVSPLYPGSSSMFDGSSMRDVEEVGATPCNTPKPDRSGGIKWRSTIAAAAAARARLEARRAETRTDMPRRRPFELHRSLSCAS